MGKWTQKDTARETGAGGKETARAWHKAREDAKESGEIGDGGCFIATAVYGDLNAPQVIALRKFRDESLLRSAGGRFFVRLYYRLSPSLADFIRRHHFLKAVSRAPLGFLIRVVK